MKSDSIDFTRVSVHRLKEVLFDIADFKCRNVSYADYIKNRAYVDQTSSISQTWVFVYKNQKVIGYVSIAMGNLNRNVHEKLAQFPYANVPGLLLGQLATHQDFEGLGMGQAMVKWVIGRAINYAKDIGCRIVYLNPDKGVDTWYSEKMGFIETVKSNPKIMFFDTHKILTKQPKV